MSKVEKDKVIEIHYTLRRADGKIEDTTEGEPPLPYLHGAGNIVPGLEQALEGRSTGDSLSVTLTPDQGYGDYDEGLLQEIMLESLPVGTDLSEGDEIFLLDDEGMEIPGVVERIEDNTLIVNVNHPLAGETLTFDVEIANIRDATAEELEHGHAHDPYSESDEDDEEWDEDDEDWDDEDWDEDDEEWEEEEDDSESKPPR
ncbi:MAG: peptidylprolyl isomerase [Geodermatophilaceae bacterium]|nr:peptidylprolyl isomerase [Geodermatophilaceae bacterium]